MNHQTSHCAELSLKIHPGHPRLTEPLSSSPPRLAALLALRCPFLWAGSFHPGVLAGCWVCVQGRLAGQPACQGCAATCHQGPCSRMQRGAGASHVPAQTFIDLDLRVPRKAWPQSFLVQSQGCGGWAPGKEMGFLKICP